MPITTFTTDEQIEMMREELRQAKKKKKGVKGQFFKATGLFVFVVLVLILLFTFYSVISAKNKGKIPNLLGYQFYVVQSGSMSPALEVGTVIITKTPKDSSQMKVDDIVTYKTNEGIVVTHRIIEVIGTADGQIKYRTKGDNPINTPDQELLDPQQILAKFLAKVPLT